MRGRGIGTARGRATIMRGLSFFFALLSSSMILTEKIAFLTFFFANNIHCR